MESTRLGEELGRLSGQLSGLAPALEHMEARERDTVAKIATLETKMTSVQRDLDQFSQKVSARQREMMGRLENLSSQSATHVGTSDLRNLYKKVDDLETKSQALEKTLTAMEKLRTNIWKKVWDICKIMIAVLLTAIITKYWGVKP